MRWTKVASTLEGLTYLLFCLCFLDVPSHRVISDIEGVVFGSVLSVVSALHDERVGFVSPDSDLWYEHAVYEPRNTP